MSNYTGSWIPAPLGSPFHGDYPKKMIPLISERLKLGPAPSLKFERGTQSFGGSIPCSALSADSEVGNVEYLGVINRGRLVIIAATRIV